MSYLYSSIYRFVLVSMLILGFYHIPVYTSAQEVTFSDQILLTGNPTDVRSVICSDLDGDGDSDVLGASSVADMIVWFENIDGIGLFSTMRIITTETLDARGVASADLDGDGDQDVLSASDDDNKIAWYENINGHGEFGPQQVISPQALGAKSVYCADLDGDGDFDVLSASGIDSKIAWYENTDGLGDFSEHHVITLDADNAESVYSRDLDNDGDNDVLSASSLDDKIAWYENMDGFGNFGEQQVITTNADGAICVTSADVDGDGDYDVLSASSDDDKIAWYENIDELATFGPQQVITEGAGQARAVFYADLDSDDDMDVISSSWQNGRVAWYENTDGLGEFGPQQILIEHYGGNAGASIFSTDLDSDGDNDVIAAFCNKSKIVWFEDCDGMGHFGIEKIITPKSDGPRSMYCTDLDGDGDNDILSASQYDNQIAWYENLDGFGDFSLPRIITTEADAANSVFSADLDGDGDFDVISASSEDDKVAWYENADGLGNFGQQQIISTDANQAFSVFSVDLDSDGDNDVVVAAYLDNMIAWYENTDGLGDFGQEQIISTEAEGTLYLFCSDLDGDGDHDVISTSEIDNKIAWYENTDGFGEFGQQQIITTEIDQPYSVYAIDLDGDGDNDVVSASNEDDKVAWYENMNGLGNFGPQQIISDDIYGARSVHGADFDGDGDSDILISSYYDDKVSWFENTDGLGSFGLEQVITERADGVTTVFSGDIDGDGDIDALSASFKDDKIAWYRNTMISRPPQSYNLLEPDDGSVSGSLEISLSWEEAIDPDDNLSHYLIHVSNNPDDIEESVIDSSISTSLTFVGENHLQYWWTISAVDEAGYSTWANQVFSFTIDFVPVEETNNLDLPIKYEITSIYPNPFNPVTSITIGLPEPADLQVSVFNILGQQVASLADSRFSTGYHKLNFDGSGYSSGIYFASVNIPGKLNEIRKVVLMK